LPPTITKCGFIDLWTWTPRSIGGLKTLATSDHDLSLAAFITNIAEPEFSAHTSVKSSESCAILWLISPELDHL